MAPGQSAVAVGNSTASGNYAFSTGYGSTASGVMSFAGGGNATASGGYSLAYGFTALATGSNAVAMGSGNAMAYGSFAAGDGSFANGMLSTAFGWGTKANGAFSTVIGAFNDSVQAVNSTLEASPAEPLFIIGNGTNFNARSNAMVVRYNGNTDISGYTRLGTVADNSPRVKIREVQSINTASTDGGVVTVVHGLDRSKIIAMNVLLNYGNGDVIPGFRGSPGFEYSTAYDDINIYVYNIAGNSANILSKPLKISITYKE
ncbi:MAG: hypothetical protein IPP72_15215 [Chitinophagaceae bacterium]|nr:hypothetical protein [Chitinophagaceae bacterium]